MYICLMRTSRYITRAILKSQDTAYIKLILQLATATIALSIAVMIITISVISGFEKEISKKIFDFWGHITVKDLNSRGSLESVPIDSVNVFQDSIMNLNQVSYLVADGNGNWVKKKTQAGIRATQEFIHIPAIIQTSESMEGVRLRGLSANINKNRFLRSYITHGSWLEKSPEKNLIILSRSIADRLKLNVGDKIVVHVIYGGKQIPRRFTVHGIYSTGLEEFDSRIALVDIDFIRGIVGWKKHQAGGISILVENMDDIRGFTNYLNYHVLPQNLYAESIRSQLRALFEWLSLQDVNKVLILSLLTIVCLINMTTVLIILILEQSNLIGILKSLGAGNRMLGEIFLYYASYILLRALIIGNLIGLGLCVLQYYTHILPLDETNYYLSYVPIHFEWLQYVLINLGCFLITLLFLLIPSMLIARINPVKVLRFE